MNKQDIIDEKGAVSRSVSRDLFDGAVDMGECNSMYYNNYKSIMKTCHCEKCAVCGNPKHSGIHAPFFGQPPGSTPYGHTFVSKR